VRFRKVEKQVGRKECAVGTREARNLWWLARRQGREVRDEGGVQGRTLIRHDICSITMNVSDGRSRCRVCKNVEVSDLG
jgi:hypothetical protein